MARAVSMDTCGSADGWTGSWIVDIHFDTQTQKGTWGFSAGFLIDFVHVVNPGVDMRVSQEYGRIFMIWNVRPMIDPKFGACKG